MGTKCAPNYAIIFMDHLEQGFLQTQLLTPLMWWRYIDDIFFVWSHSREELNPFMNELNIYHSTIKFTYEASETHINFLDTTVLLAKDGTHVLCTLPYILNPQMPTYTCTTPQPTHTIRSKAYQEVNFNVSGKSAPVFRTTKPMPRNSNNTSYHEVIRTNYWKIT